MADSQHHCPEDKSQELIRIAREHAQRGELHLAEHFTRRALELAPAGSAEARQARRVLAFTRSLGGDLEGALAVCAEAEDDDEASELRRVILSDWGDVRGAAQEFAGRAGFDKVAAFVAALLDFEVGDLARCRARALKLARSEDRETSARGHVLLSRLALVQGGVRNAVDLGRHAVRLADPHVSRSARIAARFAQSYAEEAMGLPHRARRSIESALGHARRASDRPAQVRAHLRLAELAAVQHDSSLAMTHAQGALSMVPPRVPTPLRAEAFLRAAIASRQLATAVATGLGWANDRGAAAAATGLRTQALAELARIDHDSMGALAVLRAELELEWGAREAAVELLEAWLDAGVPCADLSLEQPAGGHRGALALPVARLAIRLRRGSDALVVLDWAPKTVRESEAGRAVSALALRQSGRLIEALAVVGGRSRTDAALIGLDGRKRRRKPMTGEFMSQPHPESHDDNCGRDVGRASTIPQVKRPTDTEQFARVDSSSDTEFRTLKAAASSLADPRRDSKRDVWAGVRSVPLSQLSNSGHATSSSARTVTAGRVDSFEPRRTDLDSGSISEADRRKGTSPTTASSGMREMPESGGEFNRLVTDGDATDANGRASAVSQFHQEALTGGRHSGEADRPLRHADAGSSAFRKGGRVCNNHPAGEAADNARGVASNHEGVASLHGAHTDDRASASVSADERPASNQADWVGNLTSDDDDGLPRRTTPTAPPCRRRRDRRRTAVGPVSDLSYERVRRTRYAEILLLRVRECLLRDLGDRLEAQRCLVRWTTAACAEPDRAIAMLDRFGLSGEPTLRLQLASEEVLMSREEADLLLPGAHVDVLLDVNRRVLHRPDGLRVQLEGQPKMFEAIEVLFRNAGKDLTRERFFEVLWGNKNQKYDGEVHEQKVVKTLQRISNLIGESSDGRDVLRFSRESEIAFDPRLRLGLLESATPHQSPLGLRATRIMHELENGTFTAAELSLLTGLEQGRLMLELADLIRRSEVERIGHGRGVRYRRVPRPDRITRNKAA